MTTYVLVPGAGGDAFVWHRLVPLIEAAGHRAVPVDLPADDPEAGLAAYADAVVAAVETRGPGPVTLVAASMGAFSAPLTVGRLVVAEIALVNAMVPVPGESAGEWWAMTGQPGARAVAEEASGRDPAAPFDPVDGFFHDVPDDVRDAALAPGEPAQADRPFGEPWPLPAWPAVRTRGVAGRDDRLFSCDFQREVARARLGLELDVIAGGHLLALANPGGLAAWLLGH